MTDSSELPRLPQRAEASHKGDFGHALLIGGSRGMSGAISLAGMATLRSGAGLATLAVPDVCLETVASFEPSYMTAPLPCDDSGRLGDSTWDSLEPLIGRATVVVCGPGLGRSDQLTQLVRRLYESVKHPMVIDADGLNALAAHANGLRDPGGPRVLTPHPGEFRRLWGRGDIPLEQLGECAVVMAKRHDAVIVLKGHRTLITDGRRAERNATGNPGMATGGTGDVLTGVIAGLLCQELEPWEAARLGVYLHGLAGDVAATRLSQTCMIARDLVQYLPDAFRRLEERDLDTA